MIKQEVGWEMQLEACSNGKLLELLLIRHVAALACNNMLILCATITDAASDGGH